MQHSEVDQPNYTSSHSSVLGTALAGSSLMAASPEIDENKNENEVKNLSSII
jgi:hypothetical protein